MKWQLASGMEARGQKRCYMPFSLEGDGPQKKKVKIRDQKRGAAAWDLLKESVEIQELAERLLVHVVADDTALLRYIPAIRKWLQYVEDNQLWCTTEAEQDFSLAMYMAHLCYQKDLGPATGDHLMNG